jgi:hypothetical protein
MIISNFVIVIKYVLKVIIGQLYYIGILNISLRDKFE